LQAACIATLFQVATKAISQTFFGGSWDYVQVLVPALSAVMFMKDGGPANPIKFVSKQMKSLRSTAKIFQFERCQWGRLSKNSDLEINELTDFSLDFSG
jgi:hypothetical protein